MMMAEDSETDEAASNVNIVLASPPTRLLTIIFMQQLMTAGCLWGIDGVIISKINRINMQSAAHRLQVG